MSQLPVAVIGAGPVGLAAAAHLISRGETPVIIEMGASPAANIRKWAHVRMFSPFQYNVDPASVALLEAAGWQMPDPDHLPTGADMLRDYLEPLANLPQIKANLRLNTKVVSIARAGYDKVKTARREDAPFLLHLQCNDGSEDQIYAKAVIDASGTYGNPNPLGGSGVPALGEKALSTNIFYGIPDVLGADHSRYTDKRVLVVGSGHSAFNALLDLAARLDVAQITWVTRRTNLRQLYGGGTNDQLPARGSLGQRLRAVVESGRVQLVNGYSIARLVKTPAGIVASNGTTDLDPVDEIVVATGLRPDLSIEQELRLAIDPALESVAALADVIDPNVHSCGSVPPHGAEQLLQPEKDFFIVGMKSYGRAPNFLMLTGYEQVRSVVAALVGDWESARQVHLVLPETGVCSTDFASEGAASCCTTASVEVVEVAAAASASCCNTASAEAVADAASASGCCTPISAAEQATSGACCAPATDLIQIGNSSGGCGCGSTTSAPIQLLDNVRA